MSDEEFLARWSRRKTEAKVGKDAPPSPDGATEARDPAPVPGASENAAKAEVDLSNLPSIDSIGAGTDITAFLRKGIPPELSREALRRAWSADPVIRDFVGLAENAWDFNDPNAMPGFGPLDLSVERLASLVEMIVGGERGAAESRPTAVADEQNTCQAEDAGPERERVSERRTDQAAATLLESEDSTTEPSVISAAPQQEPLQRSDVVDESRKPRGHGSALPR